MILISKNIFKALAKKPNAMKTIIIGAVALVAVPSTVFGYATQKSDVVEEASSIVEVGSVSDDTADTTKASVASVDSNIADVLNISAQKVSVNTTSLGGQVLEGSISDYMTDIINIGSNVDKTVKNVNLQSNAKTNTTTTAEVTTTEVKPTVEVSTETEPAPVVAEAPVENTVPAEPQEPAEPIRECIVYKPSTHYVHKSTCRWADSSCYEITDTNGIEARRCSDCNPDIEIVTEYVEPVPETPTYGIDEYSRQLLAEIVWHEAGSNWISQYNKAKIAAGIMNRVYDSRFPGTVYSVLTAPGQFTGYWPGCCTPTQDCYDAVDYYFAHTNEFNSDNSWWGDGSQNHFYYQ